MKLEGQKGLYTLQQSPPAWGRGLKLQPLDERDAARVAPRVGAWIETASLDQVLADTRSPPAWGRGLKLI